MADQSDATLVFRSSFFTLWRWITMLSSVVAAIVFVILSMMGANQTVLPTIGLSLSGGAFFYIAIQLFPVYVLGDGVRGYDFWGIYRTLRWEEITKFHRRSVAGLPYLVLANEPNTVKIWLPLYLADMPGFQWAVKERAGDDHPLVANLSRHCGFVVRQ